MQEVTTQLAMFEEVPCVFVKPYYLLLDWGREYCRPAKCFPKRCCHLSISRPCNISWKRRLEAGVGKIFFWPVGAKAALKNIFIDFLYWKEEMRGRGKVRGEEK